MNRYALLIGVTIAIASAGANAECDVDTGKKVFNKCVACHSMEPGQHMMGPSLHGLMGREVGTVEGFMYSAAMEEADTRLVSDQPCQKPAQERALQC